MFHIYILILSLAGQPMQVLQSKAEFATQAACEAAIPDALATVQAYINADKELAANVQVGAAKCMQPDSAAVTPQPQNVGPKP